MIVGRGGGSATGTQNAAVANGGSPQVNFGSCTEEYNGSSWSIGGASSIYRSEVGNAGAQDSAITFGGYNVPATPSPGYIVSTEEYNGYLPVSASFGKTIGATTITGNASLLTNTEFGTGVVSSSAQLATDISGSFDSGFEFTGTIGSRTGVWSVGGTLPRENNSHAGAGLQNAALSLGGHPGPQSNVEHYNGTAWSAGGALSIARRSHFADGTEYAALVAGGEPSEKVSTEEYYGETWAAGGNLITGRFGTVGGGTQNSSFAAGGRSSEGNPLSCTEEYDGSTWSAGGALATGQNYGSGTGTQNAGLFSAGTTSPYGTQEYDGTAWSEGAASITPRRSNDIVGLQNAASLFGGYKISPAGSSDDTEEYDGTNWSVGGTLINARYANAGAGTRTSGLTFGGTGATTSTEHYESYIASASFGRVDASAIAGSGTGLKNSKPESFLSSSFQIERDISGSFLYGVDALTGTIGTATGVWSTGVSLITSRNGGHGAGTTGAGLVSGGQTPSTVANTEEWNGSTWSDSGNLITARKHLRGSTGSQNAALMGGAEPGMTCTEEYNGASWASGGALSSNRKVSVGFGIQNAAVQTGNYQCSADWTALYDGTAWSRGARPAFHAKDGGDGTDHFAGAGTQNAGLVFAGRVAKTNTEHFDGTSWSKGGSLSTGKSYANGSGVENAALAFGGTALSPSNNGLSEEYDGVAWSSGGTMITSFGSGNTFGTLESTLASHRTVDTQEYSSYHIKTGASCFGYISATSASIDGGSRYNTNFFPSGSDAFCGSAAKDCYGTMLSGSGVPRNVVRTDGKRNTDKLEVERSFQMPIFYTDPVTGSAGELWYNAVDNSLKFTYGLNTWSAGGSMLIGRDDFGMTGTQNAGLAGGGMAGGSTITGSVEEYNGSSWSVGGALIIAVVNHEFTGTQNAGLSMAGRVPASPADTYLTQAEGYNGTTWAAAGSAIGTGRMCFGAGGSQNATFIAAGWTPTAISKTELYNGMSWTEVADTITSGNRAGLGTVNAGLLFGKSNNQATTEEWNGSTWAAATDMINGRHYHDGSGTQYAAFVAGGDVAASNTSTLTEEYNGTSWSVAQELITARCNGKAAGTQSSGLLAGGHPGLTNTEEYSENIIKTVCLNS